MRGQVITTVLPAPAAGADWTFTPSPTDRVHVLTITGKLTTAAAVANRVVALRCEDLNAVNYYQADAVYPQAASLAVTYSWSRNGGNGANPAIFTGESVGLALWSHWLEPGDRVGSLTANIAAADQWSAIVARYVVLEHWVMLEELGELAALAARQASG